MPVILPPCPATLRAVQFYLKTASEHDERDPVVSYWCRLWALQCALKIDKKSDEAKVFLMQLMDWLELTKKGMSDNEAITNEVAAQAHIENYALKLFLWADGQDRAGQFNKNVVKSFFSAGILMDVLAVFGERNEDISSSCKYAKWKAAYIHNCLKNGETPVPGPMQQDDDEANFMQDDSQPSTSDKNNFNQNIGFQFGNSGFNLPDPPSTLSDGGSNHSVQPTISMPGVPPRQPQLPSPSSNYSVTPTPIAVPPSVPSKDDYGDNKISPIAKETGKSLDPEQITKAQKYCKWAISALNYDDVSEAVSNIQKALKLLETGDES